MIKVLIVFGTRPEAIKMAPVIKLLTGSEKFDVRVCLTAQHRQMLDQVVSFFSIKSDYDLNLMSPGQDLYSLSAQLLLQLKVVLEDFQPDYVMVHGDTTTSMIASLASYYGHFKVAHVEAGLRTYNKSAPFPEEINRQLTGRIADLHFAPTTKAKDNLMSEGVNEDLIFVTGNTVIDALFIALGRLKTYSDQEINFLEGRLEGVAKMILVTGHRRESFGSGFLNICNALKRVADQNSDTVIVFPVHLNPNVQKPVYDILGNTENVLLLQPFAYPAFVWAMNRSRFILTDSGGVQEEAPSLGKPVLVMRDTTERGEALASGCIKLVGTNEELIVNECNLLLNNRKYYESMIPTGSIYGDGKASERILSVLLKENHE